MPSDSSKWHWMPVHCPISGIYCLISTVYCYILDQRCKVRGRLRQPPKWRLPLNTSEPPSAKSSPDSTVVRIPNSWQSQQPLSNMPEDVSKRQPTACEGLAESDAPQTVSESRSAGGTYPTRLISIGSDKWKLAGGVTRGSDVAARGFSRLRSTPELRSSVRGGDRDSGDCLIRVRPGDLLP